MSQAQAIRKHLEAGHTITPMQALSAYGCARLAARIYDLRSIGLKINSRIASRRNKHFSEYWLVR